MTDVAVRNDAADPVKIVAQGDKGDAATVAVGTVSQLSAGSAPTVTNAGTPNAAVFNFAFPAPPTPAFSAIASDAEAIAGTDDTKGMTPKKVAEAIASRLIFSKAFQSTPQTITPGTPVSLAHGLGLVPKIIRATLVCVTAELGYSIGDEVSANMTADNYTSSFGMGLKADATNIGYIVATAGFGVVNFSTGAVQVITAANWTLVFRAYA